MAELTRHLEIRPKVVAGPGEVGSDQGDETERVRHLHLDRGVLRRSGQEERGLGLGLGGVQLVARQQCRGQRSPSERPATRLADGRDLVAGGFDGTAYLATAETYDPATGTFGPTRP